MVGALSLLLRPAFITSAYQALGKGKLGQQPKDQGSLIRLLYG